MDVEKRHHAIRILKVDRSDFLVSLELRMTLFEEGLKFVDFQHLFGGMGFGIKIGEQRKDAVGGLFRFHGFRVHGEGQGVHVIPHQTVRRVFPGASLSFIDAFVFPRGLDVIGDQVLALLLPQNVFHALQDLLVLFQLVRVELRLDSSQRRQGTLHPSCPDEIRIALVDMDGTATRSTDALNFEATRRVFGNIGITIDRTTYSLAQGRSREDGIEQILRALNRDDLLADVSLLAEQKNREANIIRRNLTPEDVPREDRRVLQTLRDQGFLIALGTTSRNGLDTLNRVRLTSAFDVIVTGNEASIKTEIWQLAFRYLDAKPSQAIVIEDAQTGIDAAVNLGVTFSVEVGSGRLAATVNISSLSELQVERR